VYTWEVDRAKRPLHCIRLGSNMDGITIYIYIYNIDGITGMILTIWTERNKDDTIESNPNPSFLNQEHIKHIKTREKHMYIPAATTN